MLDDPNQYTLSLKAAKDAVEEVVDWSSGNPKIRLIKMLRDATRTVAGKVYADARREIDGLNQIIDARELTIDRLQKLLDAYPGGPKAEQERVIEERVKERTAVLTSEIEALEREVDAQCVALAKAQDDAEAFKNALRRAL